MVEVDDATKAKLLKQVEFYFSDSNLPKDKFLREQVASNPDGFVDLRTIVAFSRMQTLLKLTAKAPAEVPEEAVQTVANVLRTSTHLDVSEDGTKIKRRDALRDVEAISQEVDARSLYAAPFPVDTTLEELTEVFHTEGAHVNSIRMRKHPTSKTFKGSVFVEFSSIEEAQKALAIPLVYKDAPVRKQWKNEYMAAKKGARKDRASARGGADALHEHDSNDDLSDGTGGKVGDRTARATGAAAFTSAGPPTSAAAPAAAASKKRAREANNADHEGAEETAVGEDAAAGPDAAAEAGEEDTAIPEAQLSYSPGSVLAFTLEEPLPETQGPMIIIDEFGGKDKLRFVELNEARNGGFLRFANPELCASALAELNAASPEERLIASLKATVRLIEGEEEIEFHKRAKAAHGGRGRGGRRGGSRDGFRGRGSRGRGARGSGRRGGGYRGRGRGRG